MNTMSLSTSATWLASVKMNISTSLIIELSSSIDVFTDQIQLLMQNIQISKTVARAKITEYPSLFHSKLKCQCLL